MFCESRSNKYHTCRHGQVLGSSHVQTGIPPITSVSHHWLAKTVKFVKVPTTSWSSWLAIWRTILLVNYVYDLYKYKVTCRAKGTLPADPCCENLQSSNWNPKQLCMPRVQPWGVVETSSCDSCFLVLPLQEKNKSKEPQQVWKPAN